MITLIKVDHYFLVFDSVVSFFRFFFFDVYGLRYFSAKNPFLSITDRMQLECDDDIH